MFLKSFEVDNVTSFIILINTFNSFIYLEGTARWNLTRRDETLLPNSTINKINELYSEVFEAEGANFINVNRATSFPNTDEVFSSKYLTHIAQLVSSIISILFLMLIVNKNTSHRHIHSMKKYLILFTMYHALFSCLSYLSA